MGNFSRFFIDRPVFASVIAIVIIARRPAGGEAAAGRAVPGDRAADGDHHHLVPGRERRDDRRAPSPRRSRSSSPARRGMIYFSLELLLGRHAHHHRHLRGRHRRRRGDLPGQQPRAGRAAAPARGGAPQRRDRAEALERHPAGDRAASRPATSADTLFLADYASINIVDELKRIPGVGDVTIFGARDSSMRVWLQSRTRWRAWASRRPTSPPRIRAQNAQYAAGSIGAEPAPPGPDVILHRDGARAPGARRRSSRTSWCARSGPQRRAAH